MAMNRQTKRMLQRQGQLGEDGQPVAKQRQRPTPPQPRQKAREERTGPIQFLREVRAELRKVAWPTRQEVINYSIIVLVCLVVLTSLIFGLDYLFAKAALELFNT